MKALIARLIDLARNEPTVFRLIVMPYVAALAGLAARYGFGLDPEAVIGGLVLLVTVNGAKVRSLVTPEHRAADRQISAWHDGWIDGYEAGVGQSNFPGRAEAYPDADPPASCP